MLTYKITTMKELKLNNLHKNSLAEKLQSMVVGGADEQCVCICGCGSNGEAVNIRNGNANHTAGKFHPAGGTYYPTIVVK